MIVNWYNSVLDVIQYGKIAFDPTNDGFKIKKEKAHAIIIIIKAILPIIYTPLLSIK